MQLTLTLDMGWAPIALCGALEVLQVGIERALESSPASSSASAQRPAHAQVGAPDPERTREPI